MAIDADIYGGRRRPYSDSRTWGHSSSDSPMRLCCRRAMRASSSPSPVPAAKSCCGAVAPRIISLPPDPAFCRDHYISRALWLVRFSGMNAALPACHFRKIFLRASPPNLWLKILQRGLWRCESGQVSTDGQPWWIMSGT